MIGFSQLQLLTQIAMSSFCFEAVTMIIIKEHLISYFQTIKVEPKKPSNKIIIVVVFILFALLLISINPW